MKLKVFGILIISLLLGCIIAAGSYPYAEKYKLNVSEDELIDIIMELKREDILQSPPFAIDMGLPQKRGHWYHIDFYYQDKKEQVFCYVRRSTKNTTTFALVAINEGIVDGNWKDINTDFSCSENKERIAEFEERILSKIEQRIAERKKKLP